MSAGRRSDLDLETILFFLVGTIVFLFSFSCTASFVRCFIDDTFRITVLKMLLSILISMAAIVVLGLLVMSKNDLLTVLYICLLSLLLVAEYLVLLYREYASVKYYLKGILSFFIISLIINVYVVILTLVFLPLVMYDFNIYLLEVVPFVFIAFKIIPSVFLYFRIIRKKLFLKMRVRDGLFSVFIFFICIYHAFIPLIFEFINSDSGDYSVESLMILYVIKAFSFILMVTILLLQLGVRLSVFYSQESRNMERFLELELAASRAYKNAQEETRAFRHDINNNLSVISSLMQQKKYDQAEEYVNTLRGNISALSPSVVTGDEMLDSLLSAKKSECDRSGIDFRINGAVEGGLGWNAVDICSVFANAMDNAIEACSQLPPDHPKRIELSFRKTDFQRIITIKNSIAAPVDCSKFEERYTSKKDKGMHGYGIKNIRTAVEHYGGMTQFSSTESEFTLTILLMSQGVNAVKKKRRKK